MKEIIVNVITSDFVCNDGTKWINGKVDIVVDFDINKSYNDKRTLNTLNTTYARAKAANVDINSIGKVIDFDIIHHKAGDTYITPWGDSIKFKHDCDEVIINKVI